MKIILIFRSPFPNQRTSKTEKIVRLDEEDILNYIEKYNLSRDLHEPVIVDFKIIEATR